MDEITKRNNAALNEYVKSIESRMSKMFQRIQELEGTIASMQSEMGALRQIASVNLAKNFNGGPTSRT